MKIGSVIFVNVTLLPVEFVVEDLEHVRIRTFRGVIVGIDEMPEFEPIAYVHEDIMVSVGFGKSHVRVQIAVDVRWSCLRISDQSRIYQVTIRDVRHVP